MNVALIGCGTIGNVHARINGHYGLNVVVCADIDGDKAARMAAVVEAESTTDCLSALRRGDVDIVAICTPTPRHAEYVIAAAEAGKHIFCEKPFCRTLPQCEEALAVVKRAGVKLFIGHVVRFFQEFEAIKAQLDAGSIGKPGYVKTFRGGGHPGGWFNDFALSGGVTMDTIIHDFDWLRYAFGDPERVFCQILRRTDCIDYSQVTFRMKNGMVAYTTGSWAQPAGFRVAVEVCGDAGMLTYTSDDVPLQAMLRQETGHAGGAIIPESPVPESPYTLEWGDFVQWIEGKGQPRVTSEDGVWAVRMALGALESAESGQPVVFR